MDYSRFFNEIAKKKEGTILRELFNLQVDGGEGWIYLVGGIPNESLFPLKSGELTMADGTKITLTEDLMKQCQQYGPTAGYPPLIKQLGKLVRKYHDPPCWDEKMLAISNGCQDALSKAINMMMTKGDYVLLEEPAYSSVLSLLMPYTPRFLPLETDDLGLKPDSLRAALSRWSPEEMSKAEKDVPKFLYTNPSGCNPTGTILSAERRKEIYKICCRYNLVIIEDDPYYFQQFIPEEEYPPSFLRLDTENRVIRLDSFSKTIGGGLRVGFAVGPKPLVQKIVFYNQTSNQHTSNISQVVIHQLLTTWGEDGFEKHLRHIKETYQKRRDAVVVSAEKHLSGLCEWTVPAGGLFMWIKVVGIPNVWDMVTENAAAKKVILVPGNAFNTNTSKPCQYIRVPYSFAPLDEIEEAFRRFAEMIRDEIKFKSARG